MATTLPRRCVLAMQPSAANDLPRSGETLSVAIAEEYFDSAIARTARFGVVTGDRLTSAAAIDLETIRGDAACNEVIARRVGALQRQRFVDRW